MFNLKSFYLVLIPFLLFLFNFNARCLVHGKINKGSESEETWTCDDQIQTITLDYLCDNHVDCSDKSDEAFQHCGCLKDFKCSSAPVCVPSHYRCDGVSDCADSSDEHNCGRSKPVYRCPGFSCYDDKGKCLADEDVCDGIFEDCNDGSDESQAYCDLKKNGVHYIPKPQKKVPTTSIVTTTTTTTTSTVPETTSVGIINTRVFDNCPVKPMLRKCKQFLPLLARLISKSSFDKCIQNPTTKVCRRFKLLTDLRRSLEEEGEVVTPMIDSTSVLRRCEKKPKVRFCDWYWDVLASSLGNNILKTCRNKPRNGACKKRKPVLSIRCRNSPQDCIPSNCIKSPNKKVCKPFREVIAEHLPIDFVKDCSRNPKATSKCMKYSSVLKIRRSNHPEEFIVGI